MHVSRSLLTPPPRGGGVRAETHRLEQSKLDSGRCEVVEAERGFSARVDQPLGLVRTMLHDLCSQKADSAAF